MGSKNYLQITAWCHQVIQSVAVSGGFYIDATMGNGHDTVFLSGLAGEKGRVLAMDIQEEALAATKKRLEESPFGYNTELILDGHEHMNRYADPDSADVVLFNFGYLPGGDHHKATRPDTSILAINKSLQILKSGGLLCLCVYSGGDTGFEEKDQILSFVKKLSSREYTVIVNEYYNRINNPPIPVFVFKR